jgi:NADPH-dependent 2,4-dienoyl-CoA reductase/sulfur reductase-like enzyme
MSFPNGPAYGVRRQEVLVVIGGGPYGIAAAAQATSAGSNQRHDGCHDDMRNDEMAVK